MLNKTKLMIVLLGFIIMASCTKNENHYYTVENVTVQLNSKELLETVVKPFGKMRASTTSSAPEYGHVFPASYKAYFVSKETKGEYTIGQVVKIIDVVAGGNTITIPKLNYDIYITNYEHSADKWYTWSNATEQLPQSSTNLYLYGKNNIDYSTVTEGTVELSNPYAAVMIRDNRWVNGTPKFYGDGRDYTKVTGWHLIYIRTGNTNTQIPIDIAGNPNTHFTLNRVIESNNIYQYTVDGSVPYLNDGNLGVIVKPFEKVIEETIKL